MKFMVSQVHYRSWLSLKQIIESPQPQWRKLANRRYVGILQTLIHRSNAESHEKKKFADMG